MYSSLHFVLLLLMRVISHIHGIPSTLVYIYVCTKIMFSAGGTYNTGTYILVRLWHL